MKIYYYCLIALGMLLSCETGTEKDKEESEDTLQQLLPETAAQVTVMPLQTKVFTHELLSNGKLQAGQSVVLQFKATEKIAHIYVKNGDKVTAGQTITSLELFPFQNKLQQATDELKRSGLDLQDALISQGFKIKDSASIPPATFQMLKVKSGYNRAKNNYELALFDYQNATLKTPIAGTVANLNSKENTYPNAGTPFCNIVNFQNTEVAFPIMESELGLVHIGDVVKVTPFSMPEVKMQGKITEINPWVDSNGMVQLKASVSYHPQMVEGMSVRVSIFREVEKQWVVPKQAVVLRTNRKVVFSLKDGKAYWHYVETGLENATQYTITSETLKEGDTIITSGNINLAHESPVVVQKQ